MQTPTQMPEMQTVYTSTELQTTLPRRNYQMQPNIRPMSVNIPLKSTSRPTTRPKSGIPIPGLISSISSPWIPFQRDKMLLVGFQHWPFQEV